MDAHYSDSRDVGFHQRYQIPHAQHQARQGGFFVPVDLVALAQHIPPGLLRPTVPPRPMDSSHETLVLFNIRPMGLTDFLQTQDLPQLQDVGAQMHNSALLATCILHGEDSTAPSIQPSLVEDAPQMGQRASASRDLLGFLRSMSLNSVEAIRSLLSHIGVIVIEFTDLTEFDRCNLVAMVAWLQQNLPDLIGPIQLRLPESFVSENPALADLLVPAANVAQLDDIGGAL